MSSHHKKYFSLIVAVIFFLTATIELQAQVDIETNQLSRPVLQNEATWFFDKTGTLPFDKIKNSNFDTYNKKDFSASGKNGNSWARLEVINQSGFDQEYIIQTAKWGSYEAFISSANQQTDHLLSGSLLPLHLRAQPTNTNAIKFLIGREEKKIIFLKFKSEYSIYMHSDISLQLVKQTYFEKADRQRLLWQGLFFGIIFVMAFYNLFIFFAVKDISYLYYVLSIVSIGLYFAFYYGFGIEYLWPRSPLWDTFCFTIINPFTGLTRILFYKNLFAYAYSFTEDQQNIKCTFGGLHSNISYRFSMLLFKNRFTETPDYYYRHFGCIGFNNDAGGRYCVLLY